MEYKYLSDSVEVKHVEDEEKRGVFHIEGLYTGYGSTMANALRRVLLSSIPGAAVSKVKINGVDHEFSTIPGMKEDVVEFTLNLKQLNFKFHADEPQVVKLKATGNKTTTKEVKGKDIESTSLVEVVNKDQHIATLTDPKAELDVELTVEKGLGYSPAEERKEERLPIGTIMLDCIFSPILNVQFDVEDMRVGERTDYNRIKMDIETDGSITPEDALRKANNILRDHFAKISSLWEDEEEEMGEEEEVDEDKEEEKEESEEEEE